MKKLSCPGLLLLFLATLLVNSCMYDCERGKGALVKESRDPGLFSGIRLKVPAKLIVTQGEQPGFFIEAQPNILKMIRTSLKEETLTIESESCIGDNKGITIHISRPLFTKLIVEGSGEITSTDTLAGDQLGLAVDGSGNIEVLANTDLMFGGIKGSGSIKVSGKGKTQHLRIDGSGNFACEAFRARSTDITINGSGNAS